MKAEVGWHEGRAAVLPPSSQARCTCFVGQSWQPRGLGMQGWSAEAPLQTPDHVTTLPFHTRFIV